MDASIPCHVTWLQGRTDTCKICTSLLKREIKRLANVACDTIFIHDKHSFNETGNNDGAKENASVNL